MFTTELTLAGHNRRFVISPAARDGWEFREELDHRLVRLVHYSDWHRVERALTQLVDDVADLRRRGWEVVAGEGPASYDRSEFTAPSSEV
jgi:hypothetical protein